MPHLILILVKPVLVHVALVVAILHEVPIVAPQRLLVRHANVGERRLGFASLDVRRGERGIKGERGEECRADRAGHARGVDVREG